MKPYSISAPLISACLFALLLAEPIAAKEKWVNLQTKNFNVFSNAEEKKVRELVLKLEQFRYTFSKIYPNTPAAEPVPVRVLVFKDADSFKPFKPVYNGRRRNDITGYFNQGENENIIALESTDEALRIIFHEYTHLLTSYSSIELPPWISEGLAELYSSFEMEKNEAVLGTPLATHVHYLRANDLKLFPLQTLINVDQKSQIYNEADKASFFYTQSWALVHYLMLGERGERKPQLFKYIMLLRTGKKPDQAFTEAFNTSFATMEQALRLYIANNNYPIIKYRIDTTLVEKDFTLQQVSEAEVQAQLGNLLLASNRAEEAEKYFKRAATLDPNLADAEEGLGSVALKLNRYSEAKEHFNQAIAHGSKNHLTYFEYADAIYLEKTGDQKVRPNLDPELAGQIVEKLQTVFKLRPAFAPAHHLLGLTRLASGEKYEEGAESVKTAIALAPRKKEYGLTLAQLQIKLKDYAGAKKTLGPLLEADDPDLKTAAQSILALIEDLTRSKSELGHCNQHVATKSHKGGVLFG